VARVRKKQEAQPKATIKLGVRLDWITRTMEIFLNPNVEVKRLSVEYAEFF
jgi:hypothetical protein